jgi:hypothetical protein
MKRGVSAAQPNSPLEPTGSILVAYRELRIEQRVLVD